MADSFAEDKARLLELLRRDGILHRSETQLVLSRDGESARWMLDSLCVSLTPEGLALAGRCLLHLLEGFEGRQLATLGTTAVPLLSSCLLQSQERYRGLLVRKEVKTHGSCKRIEGIIDPDEPVIILDDSVSSGLTMTECRRHLLEAGLFVEGGVCLVRFGWEAGTAVMREVGCRMEALYDIYSDFMHFMEGEPEIVDNPTLLFPAPRWNEKPAPEGLHPARLARLAAEQFLRDGRLPRPPKGLDGEYDSSGGVWVSVRDQKEIYLRHARDGFWRFPGEPTGSPAQDVVLAAYKTAMEMRDGGTGLEELAQSGIAVTFFSQLEECRVGDLDNDRYGIVVCSRERPGVMGGALPRMPGIADSWQQFRHAAYRNAELLSFEPFRIFRHDVAKAVEPQADWQPTGVPKPKEMQWHEDPTVAGRIARRARSLVLAALAGQDAPQPVLPKGFPGPQLDTIFLTVYSQGELAGCMGCQVGDLEEDLKSLARIALEDARFARIDDQADPEKVAVSVSLLHSPLDLREFPPEEVIQRVRHGQQALLAYQGERSGLLLPGCASRFNLDPLEFALEVIDKAGITRPPYGWKRWECASWLAQSGDCPQPNRLAQSGDCPQPNMTVPNKSVTVPSPQVTVPNKSVTVPSPQSESGDESGDCPQPNGGDNGGDCPQPVGDCPRPRPRPQAGDCPRLQTGEFPQVEAWGTGGQLAARHAELFANYMLRHQREDGVFYYRYQPFQDILYERLDMARLAHGAWVLTQAARQLQRQDLEEASSRAVNFLLNRLGEDEEGNLWLGGSPDASVAETSFLLLALCQRKLLPTESQTAKRLAESLWGRIGRHGLIATHRDPAEGTDDFQDYYPGQLLTALAAACSRELSSVLSDALERAFRFYRHRFRYKRGFGQVGWMMQAFSAWWMQLRRPEFADFVFEIGDWTLEYQQQNGAFINDHQPDTPGFTTALYLEGLGAALGIALEAGWEERAECCRQALEKGFRYLDSLVIQQRDRAVIPNMGWALGGLRRSATHSEVRIDFVQHGLSAALQAVGRLE